MRLAAGGECRVRRNWSNGGGCFQAGSERGDPEPGPSPGRRSRWKELRSATWAQAAGETGVRSLVSERAELS